MNNSKTNVDDLYDVRLKTFPENLKKLSDVVSKEVVKSTECNKVCTLKGKQFRTGNSCYN